MMNGRFFQGRGIEGNGFDVSSFCGGYGAMHGGFGLLLFIAVIAVIAVVVYVLIRNQKQHTAKTDILETLKLKYINGEITEEEYLKKKDVLGK